MKTTVAAACLGLGLATSVATSALANTSKPVPAELLAALKTDRFVTKTDARRGFTFKVPGQGEFKLLEVRAPGATRDCRMHLPSIVKVLAGRPVAEEPQWVNLSIWDISGHTVCFYPPNGACYAMVRFKVS